MVGMEQFITLIIAFSLLAIIFGLCEHYWPAIKHQPDLFRRDQFRLDFFYWFFNPFVTKAVTTFCAATVIFFLIGITDLDFDHIKVHGFGPVANQPFWLIVLEMLFLSDLLGYWLHRAFHRLPDLWDVHAIHHSSTTLDWLSAVRIHPLNDIITKTIRIIPFVYLGFPLTALSAYLPILILFAVFQHANVPWRFGPLGYVITSPFYHRWHHTAAEEGLNKNFAGLFPVIDMMFGTFYLPKHQPTQFGVKESIPSGFVQQMLYPFKPDRQVEGTYTSPGN